MQVPIENKGAMPIYVGGMMIPPGETRHFAEEDLPPEYRRSAAPPVADVEDPIDALLQGKVSEVIDGLSVLSDDFLARLEAREADGKARKGVLEAIVAERLVRAENAAGGAG